MCSTHLGVNGAVSGLVLGGVEATGLILGGPGRSSSCLGGDLWVVLGSSMAVLGDLGTVLHGFWAVLGGSGGFGCVRYANKTLSQSPGEGVKDSKNPGHGE